MANLYIYSLTTPFTTGDDNATSTDSWTLDPGESVDALAGNDSIVGTGIYYGIENYLGTINAGAGNDSIVGLGPFGIINYGAINGGEGNDSIVGTGGDYGITNENSGTINGNAGNDSIFGSGSGSGIENFGTINGGEGNDSIVGTGGYFGIYNPNDYIINGDAGNDYISGSSEGKAVIFKDGGIFNNGTINGGEGNDVVDALTGGFIGTGTVDLGAGNDWLKGFGEGRFIGGANRKGPGDALTLDAGTYSIANNGNGTYTINAVMVVSGFEFFAIPHPNQSENHHNPNAPLFAGCRLRNFDAAARAGTVTF